MPFIRPELRERYPFLSYNWPEVVSAVGLFWLGGSVAWKGFKYGSWVNMMVGALLCTFSVLFFLVTYRAAQVRKKPESPGIVEVTERRISFLAPTQGGIVELDDLTKLEIMTTDQGPYTQDVFWVFWLQDQSTVMIPNNAQGSEKIFDAIDGLPGVSFHKVIAAMGSTENARFTIWEAPSTS